MKRFLFRSAYLVMTCLNVSAASGADKAISIQVLPTIEEVEFPYGYEVYSSPDPSKPATKRVPGPTTARVAAFAVVPSGKLFLSDWSYERRQKGQSHFWIFIPRSGTAVPEASPDGVKLESVVQCGLQEVALVGGYTVVDGAHAKAKLLKTVKQGEKLNLCGYVETKDGVYFITDWSWDRWEKEAKVPNWIHLPDPEAAQSLKGILRSRIEEAEVALFATDEMAGIENTVYERRQLLKMRDARLPIGHLERLAAIHLLFESEKACGNTSRALALARRYLEEGKQTDTGKRFREIGQMQFHLGNFREADECWTRAYGMPPPFDLRQEPTWADLVEARLRAGKSPEDPMVRSYEQELLDVQPDAFLQLETAYRETGHAAKAIRLAKEANAALDRRKEAMQIEAREGTASPADIWKLAQAYESAGNPAACRELLVMAGSRKWDPEKDFDGWNRFDQVSPLFCLAQMAERQGLKTEMEKLTAAGMSYTFWREDNLEHAGNVDDLRSFLEYAARFGESATKRAVLDRVVEVLRPSRFRVWYPYNEQESLKCDLPAFGKDGRSLAELVIANKNYHSECRSMEMRLTRLAKDVPATKVLTKQLMEMEEAGVASYWSPKHDRLDARTDQIFSELRAITGENSRWLRNAVPTLADVQKALGPQTALVDFVRAPTGRYSAAVITQAGAPAFLDLGEADTINQLIRRYREIVTGNLGDPVNGKLLEELCSELFRLLGAPVEKVIARDITDLVICPDDQLHFLSFATLLDERGAMWIESRRICYVTNSRDLARPPSRNPMIRSALLIGNPNYLSPGPELALGRSPGSSPAGDVMLANNDRSASRADVGGVSLAALPGTEAEVDQLGNLFAEEGIPVEKWLGSEADEVKVSRIKGPAILHLATHGFYFDELTRGRIGILEKEFISSPLERAGVAVAGAQTSIKLWREGRIPPRAEDGLLMADEAALLNLEGTYLVTLSACETGMGETLSGGGIAGLKSALGLAGAENTLLTLWPISDEATVALMLDFYRRLIGGESPARAMAELQRLRLPALRKSVGYLQAVFQAGAFTLSTRAGLR